VGAFTPASFRFQRERREETAEVMMLTGGVHLSARGREREGTASGAGGAGPWAASGAGPNGLPRVQFYFYFFLSSFLFCFLKSFVSFAKRLQFDSNHFQKFSKIQNNHTEQ
jgi:hypothetical protein